MAKAILNARIYLADVDLSGYTNAAAINLKSDIVDCTTFSDSYKDKLTGLSDVITDVSGFFSTDPDTKMFNQMATSNAVLTLAPEGGAINSTAFFYRPTFSQYTPIDGKVSDMATFKLHAEGAKPLVKGRVLADKTARTISANGTKVTLGPYTSTQSLYGALHVFSASVGDTLDASIAIADRINTVLVDAGNKGTGYSQNDILTVVQAGGSLGTLRVETTGGGGSVETVSIVTNGSGYSVATGLSTTVAPAGGSGCKIGIVTITDTPVITFDQKTLVGHEWKADAGPITDVNFRAMWTIAGVTPSFTFAIVAGIADSV